MYREDRKTPNERNPKNRRPPETESPEQKHARRWRMLLQLRRQ